MQIVQREAALSQRRRSAETRELTRPSGLIGGPSQREYRVVGCYKRCRSEPCTREKRKGRAPVPAARLCPKKVSLSVR